MESNIIPGKIFPFQCQRQQENPNCFVKHIFSNRRFVCFNQKIFYKPYSQTKGKYCNAQMIGFGFCISSHIQLPQSTGNHRSVCIVTSAKAAGKIVLNNPITKSFIQLLCLYSHNRCIIYNHIKDLFIFIKTISVKRISISIKSHILSHCR